MIKKEKVVSETTETGTTDKKKYRVKIPSSFNKQLNKQGVHSLLKRRGVQSLAKRKEEIKTEKA